MKPSESCPFKLGEIAVFESWFRREVYISRIMQVHIDYYLDAGIPTIRKATKEEKKMWYENENHELVIEELSLITA